MTLRAKAIRYGYKESAETRVSFMKFGWDVNVPAGVAEIIALYFGREAAGRPAGWFMMNVHSVSPAPTTTYWSPSSS